MDGIEKQLNQVLVTNAPVQLPEKAKKWIVEYSPYIGLVLGVFGLIAAWGLWHAAHLVDVATDITNGYYKSLGIKQDVAVTHLGISFWLAWFSLLAQALISIFAFPGLKARSKVRGWNILFYGAIISLVSGIFYGLYDGSVTSIIGRLIGSAIGLYFLFQVRSYYMGKKSVETKTEVAEAPIKK